MDKEQKKSDKMGLYVPEESEEKKPSRNPKKETEKGVFGIIKLVASSYVVVNIDGNNVRVSKNRLSGKQSVGEKVKIR